MVEYTVAASPRKMSFHLPGPSSLMTLTDAYWGFDELDVPSNSLTFLSVKHSGPKRCGSLVLSRLMIALRDSENMSANPSRSVTFFSTSMPQTREMTPNGMSGTGSPVTASASAASLRYPPVQRIWAGHLLPMTRHRSLAAFAVSTDRV